MDDRKFVQLDGLRFFAVLLVLFSHWEWFGHDVSEAVNSGSRGVDLFFVISGFLITLGLIRSKESQRPLGKSLYRFYIRRALRIFPAYYLFLALVWFLNHNKIVDSAIWYLFYAGNFYNIKIQGFGGLGHLWSLSVEEQFYFVWPFLILFFPERRLPIVILSAFVISIAAKLYWMAIGTIFWVPYMNPIGCLDILSLGAGLAYAYYHHSDRLQSLLHKNSLIAAVVLQLVICFLSKYTDEWSWLYNSFMRTSWGIFCVWLAGRGIYGLQGAAGKVLEFRPITYIGKISYAVYLYQVLVPGMLMGIKYPQGESYRFPIYFVVTIAIASVSWHLFEHPILELKKRFE